MSADNPIPEIFVLWHPACDLGEILARRVYEWLRPTNGLGPEVFYRSLPAHGVGERGLPPPLPGERRRDEHPRDKNLTKAEETMQKRVTNLQIVLPLLDENLIVDRTWRYWLVSLRESPPAGSKQRIVLPVALDTTAFNMPPELCDLNCIRPKGLPLANRGAALDAYAKAKQNKNPNPSEVALAGQVEAVIRSLLKQLTEVLTRLLLPQASKEAAATAPSNDDRTRPKVTIFLSHAKVDGIVPAQRLRDYIYSQTQMAAFFDENDIASGAIFETVINNSIDAPTTAAMIAIRSAQYARRPWCRREISRFRRPIKMKIDEACPPGYECWRLYPLLVVEAMECAEDTYNIPEFGNAPLIRWSCDDPSMEEHIVTAVIRDALLATYHSTLASVVERKENQVIINWIPDPTTLLGVDPVRAGKEDLTVVHPGRGMSNIDRAVLQRSFPRVEFCSFEDLLS